VVTSVNEENKKSKEAVIVNREPRRLLGVTKIGIKKMMTNIEAKKKGARANPYVVKIFRHQFSIGV